MTDRSRHAVRGPGERSPELGEPVVARGRAKPVRSIVLRDRAEQPAAHRSLRVKVVRGVVYRVNADVHPEYVKIDSSLRLERPARRGTEVVVTGAPRKRLVP
jgi:hypothetical protein